MPFALSPRALLSGVLVALAILACGRGDAKVGDGCAIEGVATGSMREGCDATRARFTELTGLPAARVRFAFGDSMALGSAIAASVVTLRFPTPAAFERTATRLGATRAPFGGGWEADLTNIARHETGHVLLAQALHDTSAVAAGARYGTRMPDWFDEAVAQWMETATSRALRMGQARSAGREVGSLRELVGRTHPFIGRESVFEESQVTTYGACRGACGSDVRVGTRTVRRMLMRDGSVRAETTWVAPGVVPAERAGALFYPLSLSVLAFVRERFGDDGTRRLTARLAAGASSAEALGALAPGGFDAFEREWRAWLGAPAP